MWIETREGFTPKMGCTAMGQLWRGHDGMFGTCKDGRGSTPPADKVELGGPRRLGVGLGEGCRLDQDGMSEPFKGDRTANCLLCYQLLLGGGEV